MPRFTPGNAGVPITVNVAIAPVRMSPIGVKGVIVNPVEGVTEVIFNGAIPEFLIVNVYAAAGVPAGAEPTEIAGVLFGAITGAVPVAPFNTLIIDFVAVPFKYII